MEQFKKKNKVKFSIKLDPDVLEKAKKENFNISAICRYALELAIAGELYQPTKKKK